MNWEAIGAIAELLGAVGVIASLLYLSAQVRDSRGALRASASQQFDQSLHETMMSPAIEPSLLKAVQGGMADLSQLDDEAVFQFNMWINGVMHRYDNAYYQYRMGMLDTDRWEMHRADIVAVISAPGVAYWWNLKPDNHTGNQRAGPTQYSHQFVALVEEILAEEPDRGE
jgi:hypothetical protein